MKRRELNPHLSRAPREVSMFERESFPTLNAYRSNLWGDIDNEINE